VEDVFDSAICFVTTLCGMDENRNDLLFTSRSGRLEGLVRLFPDIMVISDPYDKTYRGPGTCMKACMNLTGNTVVYAAQYYNGFQKGHEDAGAHTCEDNASEYRLVVDFSSIEIKGKDLFLPGQEPKAQLENHSTNKISPVPFEWHSEKVFSAVVVPIQKQHTLRIKWGVNWAILA
jgi:hypothetical protein